MSDDELFRLMLDHLTRPNDSAVVRDMVASIIIRAIERRLTKHEVHRCVLRADQELEYAPGRSGHGDDARLVVTRVTVRDGDELVLYRRRVE